MSDYIDLQNQAVQQLKTRPVLDFFTNESYPNLAYGQLLNDEQLRNLAIISFPSLSNEYLKNRADNEPTIEELKANFKDVTYPQSMLPYLKKPLTNELDVNQFFPLYAKRLKEYEESLNERLNPEEVLRRQSAYTRFNLPDTYLGGPLDKPAQPYGMDLTQELIDAGYNPGNSLDIPGTTQFRVLMNFFAGPNYTADTANYAVERVGYGGIRNKDGNDAFGIPNPKVFPNLKPNFKYAIKDNPNNSIVYYPNGEKGDYTNPRILDAPWISPLDYAEFAAAEGLPILAEIFTGNKIYQAKKITNLAKFGIKDVNKFQKGVSKMKEYGLLGIAGGGTLFAQRFAGSALGYHDFTLTEMVTDAGIMGAFSILGQGTIDGILKGLPQAYKFLSGGRSLNEKEIVDFKNAIEENQRQWKEGGEYNDVFTGDDITVKDINDAIIDISNDVQTKIGVFDPTVSQGAKNEYFSALEQLLRREGVTNPKYIAWYKEVLDGNKDVQDKFFKAIFDGLDTSTTGATIADEVGGAINSQREEFVQKGQLLINDFVEELNNFRKPGAASAVDNVYSADYATEIRPVVQKLITERTNEYRKLLNEQDAAFLDEIGLANVPIKRASSEIRSAVDAIKAVNNFDNVVNRGLRAGDRAAKKEIDEVFPAELRDQLTAYSKNDFTISELFALRKQIGQYRNSLNIENSAERLLNDKFLALENSLDSQIIKTARRELPVDKFAEFKAYQSNSFLKMSESYNPILTEVAKLNPEQILPYFLNRTTPGTSINTPLRSFINHLDKLGEEGIAIKNGLQNDLIDNIQFNVFNPDKTPLEQSKAYFKFMEDNRALVKELFQEDNVAKFTDPKTFKEVFLPEIQAYEASVKKLNETFGEGSAYNIVANIFNKIDNTGQAINDLEQLMRIIDANGSTRLKKDVTHLFKKYVLNASSTDGAFDFRKYNAWKNQSFTPDTAAGSNLSFKGIANLIMGNKEGDRFVRNMNVLSDMSERIAETFAEGATDAAVLKSLSESFDNPELNYLKRFIIPPLTQTGRRITALERALRGRNANFVQTLIMDAQKGGDMFEKFVQGLESNRAARTFIKIYSNYQIRNGEPFNMRQEFEQSKYTKQFKDILRNREEAERQRINDLIGQEQADNMKQILDIVRRAGVDL